MYIKAILRTHHPSKRKAFSQFRFHPDPAGLIYLNFNPLEVVGRQLQITHICLI